MQVYEMTKSGRRGILINKTVEGVLLEMCDTAEQKEVTDSTFKRWWKKVEDAPEEAQQPIDMVEESFEVTPIDTTPVEEPKPEKPIKVAKPKAEKAPKTPIENKVKEFIEYLADCHGCTLYSGKVKAFVSVKLDGKAVLVFTHNAKGITLWVRESLVPGHIQHIKKNHLFGARVTLINPINDTKKDIITELFKASYTYLKTKSAQ